MVEPFVDLLGGDVIMHKIGFRTRTFVGIAFAGVLFITGCGERDTQEDAVTASDVRAAELELADSDRERAMNLALERIDLEGESDLLEIKLEREVADAVALDELADRREAEADLLAMELERAREAGSDDATLTALRDQLAHAREAADDARKDADSAHEIASMTSAQISDLDERIEDNQANQEVNLVEGIGTNDNTCGGLNVDRTSTTRQGDDGKESKPCKKKPKNPIQVGSTQLAGGVGCAGGPGGAPGPSGHVVGLANEFRGEGVVWACGGGGNPRGDEELLAVLVELDIGTVFEFDDGSSWALVPIGGIPAVVGALRESGSDVYVADERVGIGQAIAPVDLVRDAPERFAPKLTDDGFKQDRDEFGKLPAPAQLAMQPGHVGQFKAEEFGELEAVAIAGISPGLIQAMPATVIGAVDFPSDMFLVDTLSDDQLSVLDVEYVAVADEPLDMPIGGVLYDPSGTLDDTSGPTSTSKIGGPDDGDSPADAINPSDSTGGTGEVDHLGDDEADVAVEGAVGAGDEGADRDLDPVGDGGGSGAGGSGLPGDGAMSSTTTSTTVAASAEQGGDPLSDSDAGPAGE